VETRNFTEKAWIAPNRKAGRMHGVPVSRELRLVERFRRVAEDVRVWQVASRIPTSTRNRGRWSCRSGAMSYDLYEYAWHESNHAVTGTLGGARREERRQASP